MAFRPAGALFRTGFKNGSIVEIRAPPIRSMEISLLLIRHAETVWNREGRMQGFQDSPLSDTGQEQSARLGQWLRRRKVDAVYSSDAARCLETARIAFDGLDLPVRQMPELRERNLGAWEGRLWTEVVKSDPEGTRRYKQSADYRPPEGETWHELQARVMKAVREIVEGHPKGRLAVVTSGGSLRAAVIGAMELPPDTWARWATWNTGLTRLDYRDGAWKLIKFNDVAHLTGTGDGHAVF